MTTRSITPSARLLIAAALAACSSPAASPAPARRPATPAAADAPPAAAPASAASVARAADESERTRATEQAVRATRAMAAELLGRVRWSAATRSIAFDELTTDMPLAALGRRLSVTATQVEWHANSVGARWTQAHAIVCGPCESRGYEVTNVELFDQRLSLLAVRLAGVERPAGVAAPVLCEALRAEVAARLAGSVAGPCSCRSTSIPSDMASHALPAPGEPAEPPCDPDARAAFRFTVPAIEGAGWGRLEGLGQVDGERTRVSLELRGQARMKFLAAIERALDR